MLFRRVSVGSHAEDGLESAGRHRAMEPTIAEHERQLLWDMIGGR